MKDCERLELALAARADGDIDASSSAWVDAHLVGCAACRALAETTAPLTDVRGDHTTLAAVAPGAYALGIEIGRGGMGRVLAARDLRIGREVAVKELTAQAPGLAARFEREARLTARLQHPAIVPVYEIGTWPDGTPFYVMRRVGGTTLREAAAAAGSSAARLALVPALRAACEAVAFAHANRVIHRDLTPANILVGDHGETLVIDWGLAKELAAGGVATDDDDDGERDAPYRRPAEGAELTSAGTVFGTAAYMPPEQAAGEPVDARADVYALGAILYHLLAGEPPYRGASADVLAQVRAAPPPPIATRAPGAPRALASIVDKAMARDQAARYADAGALVHDLRRFLDGRLVESHAYTARERAGRWLRAHPALAAAALALAAAGSIGVYAVVRERDRTARERDRAADLAREAIAVQATLLEERGALEMRERRPWNAAAYLAEAYRLGNDSASLRYTLGAAMRSVDAVVATFPAPDTKPGQSPVFGDLSPDGQRVVATDGDVLEERRVADGALLATIPLPASWTVMTTVIECAGDERQCRHEETGADPFQHVAYSPDGARILAASSHHFALWESGTGRLVHEWSVDALYEARWLRGSGELVASFLEAWRRYAPATGELVAELDRSAGPRTRATADWLAIGGADRVDIHAVTDGRLLTTIPAPPEGEVTDSANPTTVAFALDDRGAITCHSSGAIHLWSLAATATGTLVATPGPTLHFPQEPFHYALSSSGHVIAFAKDGPIKVWSRDGGERLDIPLAPSIRDVELLAHDTILVVDRADSLDLWDAVAGKLIVALEHTKLLAWAHDAPRIVVQRSDQSLQVIALDRVMGRQRLRHVVHGLAQVADVSGDGRWLLGVDDAGAATLAGFDGSRRALPALEPPLALAADGSRALGWDRRGRMLVVDVTSGQVVRELSAAGLAVAPKVAVLTEHGDRVMAVTADGRALVFDVGRGDLVADLGPGIDDGALDDAAPRALVCRGRQNALAHDLATGTTVELDGRCIDGFQYFAGHVEVDRGSTTCVGLDCTTHAISRVVPDDALARTQSAGSMRGVDWWERHGRTNQIIDAWTRGDERGEVDCAATLPTEARDCGFDEGRLPLVRSEGVDVRSGGVRDAAGTDLYAPWSVESGLTVLTRDGRTLLARHASGLITSWPIASEARPPAVISRLVAERAQRTLAGGRLAPTLFSYR